MKELADLFDKLADEMEREIPATPAPVTQKVAKAQEPTRAAKVAELVKSATGEELPSDVADRIANDSALYDHVVKIAEHNARPTPLGSSIETRVSVPSTQREKVASAWEQWNRNLLNT